MNVKNKYFKLNMQPYDRGTENLHRTVIPKKVAVLLFYDLKGYDKICY